MNLSEQEIRETVAAVGLSKRAAAAIARDALRGESTALATVRYWYRQQHGISNIGSRTEAWLARISDPATRELARASMS